MPQEERIIESTPEYDIVIRADGKRVMRPKTVKAPLPALGPGPEGVPKGPAGEIVEMGSSVPRFLQLSNLPGTLANVGTGALSGARAGAPAGPYGAAAGGLLGGLAGGVGSAMDPESSMAQAAGSLGGMALGPLSRLLSAKNIARGPMIQAMAGSTLEGGGAAAETALENKLGTSQEDPESVFAQQGIGSLVGRLLPTNFKQNVRAGATLRTGDLMAGIEKEFADIPIKGGAVKQPYKDLIETVPATFTPTGGLGKRIGSTRITEKAARVFEDFSSFEHVLKKASPEQQQALSDHYFREVIVRPSIKVTPDGRQILSGVDVTQKFNSPLLKRQWSSFPQAVQDKYKKTIDLIMEADPGKSITFGSRIANIFMWLEGHATFRLAAAVAGAGISGGSQMSANIPGLAAGAAGGAILVPVITMLTVMGDKTLSRLASLAAKQDPVSTALLGRALMEWAARSGKPAQMTESGELMLPELDSNDLAAFSEGLQGRKKKYYEETEAPTFVRRLAGPS